MTKRKKHLKLPVTQPALPERADRPWFRRRWSRRLALVLVLAMLLWFGRGWLARIPLGQAQSALSAADPERALLWLDRSEWMGGDLAELEFYRARACRKLGRFDLCRQHLQNALDLGYDRQGVLREQWLALAHSGQLNLAEPHLRKLLSDPRGDEREIAEAYIVGYIHNHRLSQAKLLLESWKKDFPEDGRPWYLTGKMYARETNWEKADKELARAWELQPDFPETAYLRAESLLALKQYEAAREWFARIPEDSTFYLPAQVRIARAFRVQGMSREATTTIKALVLSHPDDSEALTELGVVQLDEGDYAAAAKNFRQAGATESRDLEIRYAVARALRGAGEEAAAAEQYAWLSKAQQANSDAERLKLSVLDNPDDVEARFEAGKLMLHYGIPEEGLIWLNGVFDLEPEHQATHQVLAEYYEQRMEQDERYQKLARRHRQLAGKE